LRDPFKLQGLGHRQKRGSASSRPFVANQEQGIGTQGAANLPSLSRSEFTTSFVGVSGGTNRRALHIEAKIPQFRGYDGTQSRSYATKSNHNYVRVLDCRAMQQVCVIQRMQRVISESLAGANRRQPGDANPLQKLASLPCQPPDIGVMAGIPSDRDARDVVGELSCKGGIRAAKVLQSALQLARQQQTGDDRLE